MALFSFRHSVKTFSPKTTDPARIARAGQTLAHLRYICRPQAARVVLKERLDEAPLAKIAEGAEAAAQQRSGRVCERFIIALPIEATPAQREALTSAFAENLTKGRAGWIAAIHDQRGNDQNNPHFHFVAFDIQERTGGRGRPRSLLGMARKHAVETTARMWAETHNAMMRSWGYGPESMISHLSYAERGIDRLATIHEGPGGRATRAKGQSHAVKREWRSIDEGRSRADANELIREINELKEADHERDAGGLGGADGQRRGTCKGSEPTVGEDSGRGGGNDADTTPPFIRVGGDQGATCSDRQRSEGKPAPARPESARGFIQNGGLRSRRHPVFGGRIFRRRRVRRIYRELIWLRDTLRARLMRDDPDCLGGAMGDRDPRAKGNRADIKAPGPPGSGPRPSIPRNREEAFFEHR